MFTRKNAAWMTASAVAAAIMLGGATAAQADGRDRGGWDGRRDGRFERGPGRVVVVEPRHFEPRSRVGFGVTFGEPAIIAPAPATRWVEGYYTTQTSQALVEAGHYETRYTQRVTETRYPSNGPPYTVVIQEGGSQNVWVPDRYQTVTTQVWVPGHWETCAVAPPPVIYQPSGVHVNIGGVFRF